MGITSNWITTECSQKQNIHNKTVGSPNVFEVSQDLVHVLHEGSSHKYLGRHVSGNLKQRGRVEFIIARQSLGQNSTNIGPYIQTNT